MMIQQRAGLTPMARPPSAGMNINTQLPSVLTSMFANNGVRPGFSSPGAALATNPPTQPLYPASPPIAGFADGGAVGMPGQPPMGQPPQQLGAPAAPGGAGLQGGPPQPPGAPAPQIDPQQFQQALHDFMQNHPQQVKQIVEVVQHALQSGQLSSQEFNMAVQLAVAASQNPSMWPKLRQLAIQKGLGTEQQIPQQYDQSLVFSLILAGQALQQGNMGTGNTADMGGGAAAGAMSPVMPQGPSQHLATGGMVALSNAVAKSGRADDKTIRVSGGEYVIPDHIVRQKGTDFFDKMIGKEAVK